MAVSVEYQSWTSSNYDWTDKSTSTSAPVQINDKLTSWIASVNANASNTNHQLTLSKGPADSTSTNFVGWVLELGSSTHSSAPFAVRIYSSSTTNLVFTASAGWNNDGSNGGYGSTSGDAATDTSVSWAVTGVAAEFSVASDTANGAEFFCLGWRLNNLTSQSDQLLIFKDTNGEWAAVFSDGGTLKGSYYMPVSASSSARNYAIQINSSGLNNLTGYLSQLDITNGASTFLPATGEEFTNRVVPASGFLYATYSTSEYGYGRWASLASGKTAVCMGYGPIWVVF